MGNVVDLVAIGELHHGVGKKFKNFICLNIGYGIGSGIIIERKLFSGADGFAGEVGHIVIDTNNNRKGMDGINGTLEALASGYAIAEIAQANAQNELNSRLHNIQVEKINAKTVLERFADNPFLPKFYKDQNRYAFPLEMSFLADRYQQLSDDLSQFDLFKDFVVADYHIFKSLIFAKVTLQEDEFRLYKTLFDIIYKEMPKPDLYVYLYQNTDRLLQNIKKRGRSYEQDIEAEYLEKINYGYLDYIKSQTDLNVLVIDVSDFDFVEKQEDYIKVLDAIQEKLDFKTTQTT